MAHVFASFLTWWRRLFRRIPLALESRVRFHYPEGNLADREETVFYSDRLFWEDGSAYDPHLATTSLAFAMSCFSSNQIKSDLKNQAVNAVEFLQNCGFSEIEPQPYFDAESQKDGIAFVLGKKRILSRHGATTLVAIGIRGGNYGREWSSNFRVGQGLEHDGFSLASEQILYCIRSYLRAHRLKGRLAFWVTGFSRAGGVANLVGHHLELGRVSLPKKAKMSGLFCYCFAAPYTTRDETGVNAHVYNIINPSDAIPCLPPPCWGYRRYGMDIFLPSVSQEGFEGSYELARKFYPVDYPFSPDFAFVDLDLLRVLDKRKRFSHEVPLKGWEKDHFISRIMKRIGERLTLEEYAENVQEAMEEAMTCVDPSKENAYETLADMLRTGFGAVMDELGVGRIALKILSTKTDWEETFCAIFEKAFDGKDYAAIGKTLAKALARMIFLLRDDLWEWRPLYLTLMDKNNFASFAYEHRPLVYLAWLKSIDSRYSA